MVALIMGLLGLAFWCWALLIIGCWIYVICWGLWYMRWWIAGVVFLIWVVMDIFAGTQIAQAAPPLALMFPDLTPLWR